MGRYKINLQACLATLILVALGFGLLIGLGKPEAWVVMLFVAFFGIFARYVLEIDSR